MAPMAPRSGVLTIPDPGATPGLPPSPFPHPTRLSADRLTPAFLQRYPAADILTSSDHLIETVKGEQLEDSRRAHSAANIGIMYFRPTATKFVDAWVKLILSDDKIWDQNAFNDLFRKGTNWTPDAKGLFLGYGGTLKIGILPVSMFCSGHTFFTQRMHERLNLTPYVVHATFQYAGTEGKRHRFREFMLWHDKKEYYDPAGGLLAFDASIPQALLDGARGAEWGPGQRSGALTVEGTKGHFALVNHQLKQIRTAFALAQVLGRTVVMPKMYCGMDRWWAPHHGIIPGSGLRTPFVCPMDHVFEIDTMLRKGEKFREYSLLENPRMPQSVLDSRVVVKVCPGAEACEAGVDAAGVLTIPRNLKEGAMKEALGAFRDTKILHFSTMMNAFGGFDSPGTTAQFMEKIKHWTSIWCCVHAHPGHIWYDMLFDVKGHKDRHMRVWEGEWFPKTGP